MQSAISVWLLSEQKTTQSNAFTALDSSRNM